MIEKRRSGFCTVTIPPSKTHTSGMKSQSLRVSVIEDNPLAGVLRERTVADDMSWIVTEGTLSVWTDVREMTEVSATRTVVARTTVLEVAQGALSAVRTLVLWTVDVKMPLVVTLKTNSRCERNGLRAQSGIVRCNLSGVGSGASLMKGRAGIGRLINESEGDRGGGARRFISLMSDSSYASHSTAVKVRYIGLKRHVKVRFRGGRERI